MAGTPTASTSKAAGKATASKNQGGPAAASQADETRYRTKYRQLKTKLTEVEDENVKLQMRILQSKRNIQRLRLERSILYERLNSTAPPLSEAEAPAAAPVDPNAQQSYPQQTQMALDSPADSAMNGSHPVYAS